MEKNPLPGDSRPVHPKKGGVVTKMKKLLALTVGLAALAACKEIPGKLEVRRGFAATSGSNGLFTRAETVRVIPGKYAAELQIVSSTKANLKLKLPTGEKKLKLAIPRKTLPSWEGSFKYSAAQLGQPFDMTGSLKTTVTTGPEISGVESCTRTHQSYVCGHRGRCGVVTHTTFGTQNVSYYNKYTRQNVTARLLSAGKTDILAVFDGEGNWSEKVYTFQSPCF